MEEEAVGDMDPVSSSWRGPSQVMTEKACQAKQKRRNRPGRRNDMRTQEGGVTARWCWSHHVVVVTDSSSAISSRESQSVDEASESPQAVYQSSGGNQWNKSKNGTRESRWSDEEER